MITQTSRGHPRRSLKTGDEKPFYEKPESLPLGGTPLADDEAEAVVGGGSGAADCDDTGSVAFNRCGSGSYASA